MINNIGEKRIKDNRESNNFFFTILQRCGRFFYTRIFGHSNAVIYCCSIKLLDTSVIVNSSFIEFIKKGYLEGEIIVPSFVIREIHTMSDSANLLTRNKGKTALDNLILLEPVKNITIEALGEFSKGGAVDNLLITYSKKISRKRNKPVTVITADGNLSKLMEIDGVPYFNTNEMMFWLKKPIFPKDILEITIVKRGERREQGIGYVEDGTIVVVENAGNSVGKIVVAEVINTRFATSGRIIFCMAKGNLA